MIILFVFSVLQVRNITNLSSADQDSLKISLNRPIMILDGENIIYVCMLRFYDISIFK